MWHGFTSGSQTRSNRPSVPRCLTRLASAQELLDSTIQSVRDIATTLRPGVLDELGLEAAVEWQAREFHSRDWDFM